MKVISIFLAFSSLIITKCSGEKISQTLESLNKAFEDGDSNQTNFADNTLGIIENDTYYTQTLTSCPQAIGVEGIFEITVPGLDPFPVLCDAKIAGAGYTVIASRSNVELSFFRNWTEYQRGFGDFSGDFFIGLDKLHAITKSQTHELYVHLEDFEGNTRFARYDEFYIESENQLYKLSKLGSFTGDAGDSLTRQKGASFSTYDKDNDSHSQNCAIIRIGAWWFTDCSDSNLFGVYMRVGFTTIGIYWRLWMGEYSYQNVKMMVRPKCSCTYSR
ncbi:ficolin-2-like [Drosophila tropicalis]|uniref:ficolin-2-like n=1 Tax=Drosophila tropicalis TaxID=46794 RepID=UPI0035ABA536